VSLACIPSTPERKSDKVLVSNFFFESWPAAFEVEGNGGWAPKVCGASHPAVIICY
jgi:hypothetical protein